jgi:hypothetical protein
MCEEWLRRIERSEKGVQKTIKKLREYSEE